MPIDGVTLSDERCPGERTPTRLSVAAHGPRDHAVWPRLIGCYVSVGRSWQARAGSARSDLPVDWGSHSFLLG